MTAIDTLRSLKACYQSIGRALEQTDQSPQRLWEECNRADWMAWYLGKLAARDGYGSPAHKRAVLVACLCARAASHHWRDPACERAVALAESWAWGDETVTLAALARAYATARADAAAYAAASAAWPAGSAAYAAASAATRAARLASLSDLIRAAVPEVPL